MKSIDTTFHTYPWDDKPHNISKTIDQRLIKMLYIYKQDQSVKFAWIKRIWEEPLYRTCPTCFSNI